MAENSSPNNVSCVSCFVGGAASDVKSVMSAFGAGTEVEANICSFRFDM